MTIRQLIEELNKHNPDMMVIRSGYEGGVTEIAGANKVKIMLNVNTEWYYGRHEIESKDSDTFDCEAIYIH